MSFKTQSPFERFENIMFTMAKMTNFELTPMMLEFYDNALSPYGYENVNQVLMKLFETLNSRSPMPSIAQIKTAMGVGEVSPDDKGTLAAARIVQAISKYGSWYSDKAQSFIGPLGWQVVEMQGGWQNICEVLESELSIKQAQWRAIARSIATNPEAARSPTLEPPKDPQKQLAIVKNLSDKIKGLRSGS